MRRETVGTLLILAVAAAASEPVQLPAMPALSPDGRTLAFESRGDLWLAPTAGGESRPLTRHPARDIWPVFSPDGARIAFCSDRDDAWHVYVMPATGGTPRQVTFHTEGSIPLAWFPAGDALLVRGLRDHAGLSGNRFFRVPVDERRGEELLFDDYGADADLSPDGRKLLFTREGGDIYRQGYHGSKASQIWLYDLEARTFRRVSEGDRECRWPRWKPEGNGFYYVTERGTGRFNVWERPLDGGAERQRTFFTEDPVMFPTLADDASTMVFRVRFDLYRFAPRGTGAPERIDLRISGEPADPTVERRRYTKVDNDGEWGQLDFTADGLQMVFSAGGDLWAMDTVLREPVPLTSGSDAQDRHPVFAPDGSALYFLRDTGDRVNLWRARRRDETRPWWRNRAFDLKPLTDDTAARDLLSLSPDGERLAYNQGGGDLWVCRPDGTGARRVLAALGETGYDWSPDSKWLACEASDSEDNRDVWIVNAGGSPAPFNVSRHPNWDGRPAWSPDGRILAYVGREYDNDYRIRYAYLRKEDDDLSRRDRAIEDSVGLAAKDRKDKPKDEDKAVRIDFDRLPERVRTAPLESAPANLVWSRDSKTLAFTSTLGSRRGTYKLVFPDKLRPEFMTAVVGSQARWLENNKLCWLNDDGVPAAYETPYPFEILQVRDLPAHRRLGFRQGWRVLRDGFYDERLNNLDWDAVRRKYEDAAAAAPDPQAFDRVVQMMLGELNASHLGFTPRQDAPLRAGAWKPVTGHLGVRFDPAYDGPGFRVLDVIRGGPADRAQSRLEPGDIIAALDGREVGPRDDPCRFLNGRVPRSVAVRLRTGREFALEVTSGEEIRRLVREEWIDRNCDAVARASGGRAGYIHIERMAYPDLRAFEKAVYAEGYDQDGLIIDVRGNAGGFIADRLLAILCHPRHALTVRRGGAVGYQSGYLDKAEWHKPVVVLCNQDSASNAEIFSQAIQSLGRGKLVGTPTQGSVISTPDTAILDLGTLRVPHRGWFRLRDGQDMERNGVVPDAVVWPEPGEIPGGVDRQLDRAVAVLRDEIQAAAANPPPKPIRASERPAASR